MCGTNTTHAVFPGCAASCVLPDVPRWTVPDDSDLCGGPSFAVPARDPYEPAGYKCPLGSFCVDFDSPNHGYINFDNVLSAWLTIFQCISLEDGAGGDVQRVGCGESLGLDLLRPDDHPRGLLRREPSPRGAVRVVRQREETGPEGAPGGCATRDRAQRARLGVGGGVPGGEADGDEPDDSAPQRLGAGFALEYRRARVAAELQDCARAGRRRRRREEGEWRHIGVGGGEAAAPELAAGGRRGWPRVARVGVGEDRADANGARFAGVAGIGGRDALEDLGIRRRAGVGSVARGRGGGRGHRKRATDGDSALGLEKVSEVVSAVVDVATRGQLHDGSYHRKHGADGVGVLRHAERDGAGVRDRQFVVTA